MSPSQAALTSVANDARRHAFPDDTFSHKLLFIFIALTPGKFGTEIEADLELSVDPHCHLPPHHPRTRLAPICTFRASKSKLVSKLLTFFRLAEPLLGNLQLEKLNPRGPRREQPAA